MRRGVLLFNLGGPENLREVRPFLYNLFSDPEIIRIHSDFLRKTLARIITIARLKKSKDLYRQIGGGSPLRHITEDQATALKTALASREFPAEIYVAMRCWKPTIDDAVKRILQDSIEQLILLPLFPQLSLTTTGSCLKHFQSLDRAFGLSSKIQVHAIKEWFDEPLYIQAVANTIREAMHKFSAGQSPVILYSAHSIPEQYIAAGDPYLEHIKKTVALINAELGNAHPCRLAFQSKVGPVKWLSPATKDMIMKLGREGCERALIVPLGFVSDHLETLQEIDISYRDIALHSGIKEFHRADSLNLDPLFISALANIVIKGAIKL
jgi:ferrochelatase